MYIQERYHLISLFFQDPMAIHIEWRDKFPKMGLDQKYIGDGYMACSNLSNDSFLNTSAKYRLLGKSTQSDIQNIDPDSIRTLDPSSLLRQTLCNANENGYCSYPGIVHLDRKIACTGVECNFNEPPRIVHIGDNVHYEYIKPPCVHFNIGESDDVIIVHSDGRIAIQPKNVSSSDFSALTYFRTQWSGDYPQASGNLCGFGVCETIGKWCRCKARVEEERVFSTLPSRQDILRQLKIGAISPQLSPYDANEVYSDFTLYARNSQNMLGRMSAFEVIDEFGRKCFFLNLKMSVKLLYWEGGDEISQFAFRSPPSFYDNASTADVKQAQDETDAALDHYFYHTNTAPFISLRLIQRFGISNPSPRFIKTVAESFKFGIYEAHVLGIPFGSGTYGDLGATVAGELYFLTNQVLKSCNADITNYPSLFIKCSYRVR